MCWGELAMADISPLLRRLPSLKNVPHVEILKEATQLHSLDNLNSYYASKNISADLWIKRDDQSHLPLGGNKSRKLEFLMGSVKQAGASKIITSGNWGSNHAYSTTHAAKKFGIDIELLLGNQPVTENVRQKLLADHALGAKMKYFANQVTLGMAIANSWVKAFFKKDTYYIPPGGSSPVGNLGYVNAFLELVDQVGRNKMPKRIIVPMGTAGTAAGLLVGRCIANLESDVDIIAVGIADGPLSNRRLLIKTARKLERFIKKNLDKNDLKNWNDCEISRKNSSIRYEGGFSEPGYGEATEHVKNIIRRVKEIENIKLDSTYTGKAFHYLESLISKDERPEKTLFWMTYNSYDLKKVIDRGNWSRPDRKYTDLPKRFQRLFESDVNKK